MGFLSSLFGRRTERQPLSAPAPSPPPRANAATETTAKAPREVSPDELKTLLQGESPPFLVDVRETKELKREGWIPGMTHVSTKSFKGRESEIPRDRTVAVYCAGGVRSYDVGCHLLDQGFEHVLNLTGGIQAWPHERERGEPPV